MAGTSAHCSPSRSAGERKRRLTTDSAIHPTSARFPARLDPPRWQDVPNRWAKKLPHQQPSAPGEIPPGHLAGLCQRDSIALPGSTSRAEFISRRSLGVHSGRGKRRPRLIGTSVALPFHATIETVSQTRIGVIPFPGPIRRDGMLEALEWNATRFTGLRSICGVSWLGGCMSFGCCSGTMALFCKGIPAATTPNSWPGILSWRLRTSRFWSTISKCYDGLNRILIESPEADSRRRLGNEKTQRR